MTSQEPPDRPDQQAGDADLSPHPLVPGLDELEEETDGLTTLLGFIGPSPKEGRVRVYLELSFSSYCEVANDDVVKTAPVDANDAHSPTIVWIKNSAQVGLVKVGRLTGDASFVSGAIRRRYRGRAVPADLTVKAESIDPCTEWFDCWPTPLPPKGTSWECYSESIPCPQPSRMFC